VSDNKFKAQAGHKDFREATYVPYTLNDLIRLIAKHNFCTLATQGSNGPHVSGVGYFAKGLNIYIPTSAKTTKARNLRRDSHVAVHIPIPWPLLPAPPRSIQFRGEAEILPSDNTDANAALAKGPFVMRRVFRQLIKRADTKILGENIWIHVRPIGRIETFMVGVPITTIFHDEKKVILHFDVP
jgi:uncharacterized protein YhbP (UPF0306 family)